MNPVDQRLGKSRPERQNFAERAQAKRVRQTANRILTEGNAPLWKRQFAESVLDDGIIDIDDCTEVYNASIR